MANTDKNTLRRLNKPAFERLIAGTSYSGPATEQGIRMTSGTTGGQPLVIAAHYTPLMFERYTPFLRPIILFGSLNTRLANVLFFTHGNTDSLGSVLPLDVADMQKRRAGAIAGFQADAIVGFPSHIIRLLMVCREYPNAFANVHTLLLTGERITPAILAAIREKLPRVEIRAFIGTAELGAVGESCVHLPPNHYHPYPGVTFEIDNEDEHGFGDLLLTMQGYLSPVEVIRYKSGDHARIVSEHCLCGATETIEMAGRAGYDFIRLGGALVLRDECDRVMGELSDYVVDYRIQAGEVVSADGNTIRARLVALVQPTAALRDLNGAEAFIVGEISRRLHLTPRRTLAELVERGMCLPLEIELVSEFPYQHKGVKLSRLEW